MTVSGALCAAEIAAMMPRAGGQYVFLREAYSPMFGFLFGWAMFLVVQTGTIAAVAVAFAKFLGVFCPAGRGRRLSRRARSVWADYAVSLSTQQLVAIALIVVPDRGQHAGPEAGQVDSEHVHLHQDGRAVRPDRGGPAAGQEPRERGLDVVVVEPVGQRLGLARRPCPACRVDGRGRAPALARPGDDRAAVLAVGLEQCDVHRRRDPRPGPDAAPRPDPRHCRAWSCSTCWPMSPMSSR